MVTKPYLSLHCIHASDWSASNSAKPQTEMLAPQSGLCKASEALRPHKQRQFWRSVGTRSWSTPQWRCCTHFGRPLPAPQIWGRAAPPPGGCCWRQSLWSVAIQIRKEMGVPLQDPLCPSPQLFSSSTEPPNPQVLLERAVACICLSLLPPDVCTGATQEKCPRRILRKQFRFRSWLNSTKRNSNQNLNQGLTVMLPTLGSFGKAEQATGRPRSASRVILQTRVGLSVAT